MTDSEKSWSRFGKHTVSLVASDAIGSVTAIGAVAFADSILPAQMQMAKDVLRDKVIKPNLVPIDRFLSHFSSSNLPKIQDQSAASQLDRAEKIADMSTKLGIGSVVGWTTTMASQYLMNRGFGEKRTIGQIGATLAFDAGAHLALMGIVCSPKMAPVSNKIEETAYAAVKPVFKTLGFSEEEAHKKATSTSTYILINEVPNLGGLLMGASHIAWKDFNLGKLFTGQNR